MWTAIGICLVLFVVTLLIGAAFSLAAICRERYTDFSDDESYESYERLLRIADNINHGSLVFLIIGLMIFIYWIIVTFY